MADSLHLTLIGDDNQTYEGTIYLGDIEGQTGTEAPESYDEKGASLYVIAVVLVYGFSIVLLIGSHIFLRKKEEQCELQEKQVNKFLETAITLREKSSRDTYRNLKKSIIPLIAIGIPGGPDGSDSGANSSTVSRNPSPVPSVHVTSASGSYQPIRKHSNSLKPPTLVFKECERKGEIKYPNKASPENPDVYKGLLGSEMDSDPETDDYAFKNPGLASSPSSANVRPGLVHSPNYGSQEEANSPSNSFDPPQNGAVRNVNPPLPQIKLCCSGPVPQSSIDSGYKATIQTDPVSVEELVTTV